MWGVCFGSSGPGRAVVYNYNNWYYYTIITTTTTRAKWCLHFSLILHCIDVTFLTLWPLPSPPSPTVIVYTNPYTGEFCWAALKHSSLGPPQKMLSFLGPPLKSHHLGCLYRWFPLKGPLHNAFIAWTLLKDPLICWAAVKKNIFLPP